MSFRETLWVRGWSFWKVPLLFAVRPSVVELTSRRCAVRIPFIRRNRNHLNSIYFGALCIGADCTGGMIAMKLIRESGRNVSLIFKDVKAEFLKRAEGDVIFTCEDGEAIENLVIRVIESGKRESLPVHVIATVPSLGEEPVAKFELTLSLKRRD